MKRMLLFFILSVIMRPVMAEDSATQALTASPPAQENGAMEVESTLDQAAQVLQQEIKENGQQDLTTTEASSADLATLNAHNATPANINNTTAHVNKLDNKKVSEAEIPVLSDLKVKDAKTTHTGTRLFLSFVILVCLCVGAIYFSRWYGKRHQTRDDNTKIRVLSQHFLGPRKSLAIIRVAGESILIGVTDQNISMIKSLSLIDDEFPETTPRSFASAMSTQDGKAQDSVSAQLNYNNTSENRDDVDEFVLNNIKDKVFSKIKGMRNI